MPDQVTPPAGWIDPNSAANPGRFYNPGITEWEPLEEWEARMAPHPQDPPGPDGVGEARFAVYMAMTPRELQGRMDEIEERWNAGELTRAQYEAIHDRALTSRYTAPVQPVLSTVPVPGEAQFAEQRLVDEQRLAEENAQASYMRAQGLRGYGQTSAQNWMQDQFQNAYAGYLGESALSPPGTAKTPWEQYQTQAGNPFEQRRQAARTFQQARGGDQSMFLEQIPGESFKDLLTSALMSRYAAPVAKRMGAMVPGMMQGYAASTLGAGEDLLGWLNEKLRLG